MFQGNTIIHSPTDLIDETRVNMQITACQLVTRRLSLYVAFSIEAGLSNPREEMRSSQ